MFRFRDSVIQSERLRVSRPLSSDWEWCKITLFLQSNHFLQLGICLFFTDKFHHMVVAKTLSAFGAISLTTGENFISHLLNPIANPPERLFEHFL